MLKNVRVLEFGCRVNPKLAVAAIALVLLACLPIACGSQRPEPQAQFSASSQTGRAPLTVVFANTSQNADGFQWDFGDGATASTNAANETATHRYTIAGTYTIRMTAVQNGQPPRTNETSSEVTVSPGPIERIKVTPETAKLDIGQTQKFAAEALDAFDNPVPEVKFSWEAGEGAGVLADGTLTAGTKAGTFSKGVAVTASAADQSAKSTASITINPGALKEAKVIAAEVAAGQARQLELAATDQYGNRLADVEAAWTLTDDAAGTMTKTGTLTAGEVAGTYRDALEAQVKQATSTQTVKGAVTVTAGPLAQVVVAPTPARMGIGMTQQFVAVAADKYGNRIAGLDFKWSSDNCGAIDKGGLFTAGIAAGTYKDSVKVEAAQGGKTVSAMATVTVEPDRIVFVSNRNDKQNDVYIMDADGANVQRLTSTSVNEYWPSVSPDGRRILFESYSSNDGIMVMNDDGSWVSKLMASSSTVACLDPTWSPDGSRIAFARANMDKGTTKDVGIYVMDADGGNVRQLFYTSGGVARHPSWSPDGKTIGFYSSRRQFGVNVMSVDGPDSRQMNTMWGTVDNPVWSPDGSKMAFQSYQRSQGGAKQFEIFVMNSADATDVRQLTYNDADDVEPCWSADGKKILFASLRDTKDTAEIYVMDADGKNVKRLTQNAANDLWPRWVPRKSGLKVDEASVIIPKSSPLKKVMTAQELAAKAKSAVVRIKTDLGTGSGFLIDSDGTIMTCNHVVTSATTIDVFLEDGTKYAASVKSRDMVHDLALITIKGDSLPFLEFGDLSRVSLGQQVVVLGYPLRSESVSVTSGLVSTFKFDAGRNITWVQTDSAINPGNSGGPLLNLNGQVIGVISLKTFGIGIEGQGYAISANTVNANLPKLKGG